ncbi:MAG: hypothetical protein WC560_04820 [Syntrophales bacterium]
MKNSDYYSKVAKYYEQVGEKLKSKYGKEPIPKHIIEKEFCSLSSYAKGSVLVTDYCYNLINKAKYSVQHPLFERIERGLFYYLGPGYNYNGEITWEPKGRQKSVVGYWRNGKWYLDNDPRKSA